MSKRSYLHFINAYGGDLFWLKWGENYAQSSNLIVDSGYQRNFIDLDRIMSAIKNDGQQVEGIILTHIDDDHIGGLMRCLRADKELPSIRHIFFNTSRGLTDCLKDVLDDSPYPVYVEEEPRFVGDGMDYGAKTALSILDLLCKRGLEDRLIGNSMIGTTVYLPDGAMLRFISPSRESAEIFLKHWRRSTEGTNCNYGASDILPALDELMNENISADKSPTNGGSLAFLFDYGNTHIAFLGDAHADVCESGLRTLGYSEESPYPATIVKLSHHGSAANLSDGLLRLIASDKFIMSSSESKLSISQKTVVAKLLKHRDQISIYTNFSVPKWFFTEDDRIKYIDSGKLTFKTAKKNTELGENFSLRGRMR